MCGGGVYPLNVRERNRCCEWAAPAFVYEITQTHLQSKPNLRRYGASQLANQEAVLTHDCVWERLNCVRVRGCLPTSVCVGVCVGVYLIACVCVCVWPDGHVGLDTCADETWSTQAKFACPARHHNHACTAARERTQSESHIRVGVYRAPYWPYARQASIPSTYLPLRIIRRPLFDEPLLAVRVRKRRLPSTTLNHAYSFCPTMTADDKELSEACAALRTGKTRSASYC